MNTEFDYDLAPGVLLYSAVQTAYQPGTFNGYASTPTYSNSVGSANLRAYSIGEKSRLFGDRLGFFGREALRRCC